MHQGSPVLAEDTRGYAEYKHSGRDVSSETQAPLRVGQRGRDNRAMQYHVSLLAIAVKRGLGNSITRIARRLGAIGGLATSCQVRLKAHA